MKTFLYLTLKNIQTLSVACIFANIIMLFISMIFIIIKILSEQPEINFNLIYEVFLYVTTNVFSIDFVIDFYNQYKNELISIIKLIPTVAVIIAFIQSGEQM